MTSQLQPNLTWGPILPTTPINYSGPTWAAVQNWSVIKPPLPPSSTPVTSTSNISCDKTSTSNQIFDNTSISNLICDNGLIVPTKVSVQKEASNHIPMNNDFQQNEMETEQNESSNNKENYVGINIE